MSEWKEVRLGSLVRRKIGYGIVQPGASPEKGVPVIKANNIIAGLTSIDELDNTTQEIDSKYPRTKLNGGELIISLVGTVGKTAIVPSSFAGCNLVRATGLIDIEDPSLTKWVKYYIASSKGQYYINTNLNTTVQATLNVKSLAEMPIPIPPKREMGKMVDILSSLDDKIAVNRRICENLEAQAQALFKNWFVDFAPFKDGKFVESELGLIPEGWRVGCLSDVLKLIKEPIKQGERPELPYLPIDSIPMNSFLLNEVKDNSEAQSSLVLFEKNDILVGAMRVYFHRVVPAPFRGITRSTCFVLRPKCEDYFSFALCTVNSNAAIRYAQKTSKGSTMPYAVWDGGLGSYCTIIPPRSIVEEFNTLLKMKIELIQNMFFENLRLTTLRDTLLPKLMSGEIKI